MQTEIELWELAAPAFVRAVPALLEVYRAAMAPPGDQLTGRRAIMERHAGHPRFRSFTAVRTADGSAVGFAYGFHGQRGQWWHDVVSDALRLRDPDAERHWFTDSFEIAEVHVRPEWQGRGIGRRMLEALAAERPELTAVLSTHSGPTRARALYHSCGFTDVLTDFRFPGSPDQPFTIMAAPLPLPAGGSRRSAGRSPGSRSTG
ncbi:GNAT family N-acetyltransferase [Marinitenerispora sediminis]|uniref:GNAT family N-acetyltransferase n=1 Tax=Marinitenerispora sediminis TaxID=1931232 RepID=A0A368TCH4_9ACTN|nr:GNAT family N-acetyltransferase [Marinitenerispora sediminis]RCV55267.1 GNAT family N-acetyltransferase [Marinitenerispora sediminis]RCV61629.1 GNAT family N-acetyltransferase [Marinitenerispora sediminis]RCV62641.1 GNAT family N-acetyltransferase [Marinitenerispora sediminis]